MKCPFLKFLPETRPAPEMLGPPPAGLRCSTRGGILVVRRRVSVGLLLIFLAGAAGMVLLGLALPAKSGDRGASILLYLGAALLVLWGLVDIFLMEPWQLQIDGQTILARKGTPPLRSSQMPLQDLTNLLVSDVRDTERMKRSVLVFHAMTRHEQLRVSSHQEGEWVRWQIVRFLRECARQSGLA